MKFFTPVALCLATLGSVACAQQTPLTPEPKPLPDQAQTPRVTHVVHVSVDALGAKYLEKFLQDAPDEFPAFARLKREGASTFNARTDYTHTNTLPNHTCMLTGRPVKTPEGWPECQGHFWTENKEFPAEGVPPSLHATNPDFAQNPTGAYTASAFDVAHDAGLSTAIYSGKVKFRLYPVSFGEGFGAPHTRGKNKIDHAIIENEIGPKALADLEKNKPNYAFVHFPEPDSAGHAHGYLGSEYRDAVKKVDGFLGQLLMLLETNPAWKDQSALVLSADHGGEPGTKGHGNAAHPYCYTIPFFVWGAGVKSGADLYELNALSRTNPGEGRPQYAPTGQPIRNGDGGNLALKLLGLPAIPGSHINAKQDLVVR